MRPGSLTPAVIPLQPARAELALKYPVEAGEEGEGGAGEDAGGVGEDGDAQAGVFQLPVRAGEMPAGEGSVQDFSGLKKTLMGTGLRSGPRGWRIS